MKFSLFVCLITLPMCWTAMAHAAPHASVRQPVFYFGSLSQGEKVEHAFTVRNTGDMPLTFKSIRPSCGCTAANASSSVVQPGSVATIKVTFNSTNFSGAIHKTIALETNDPRVPVTTLTLNGSVIEEITLHPRQINLGLLKANAVRKTAVLVVNSGTRPIKLVSVWTHLSQINATFNKNFIKPGKSAILNVVASLHGDNQMLSGYLTIKTDIPGKSEIIVPVYASIIK